MKERKEMTEYIGKNKMGDKRENVCVSWTVYGNSCPWTWEKTAVEGLSDIERSMFLPRNFCHMKRTGEAIFFLAPQASLNNELCCKLAVRLFRS